MWKYFHDLIFVFGGLAYLVEILAVLTGLRVYGALPHRGGRAEGRLRARA